MFYVDRDSMEPIQRSVHTIRGVFFHAWLRMITSSNGNIFRVTGPLVTGQFPSQKPVTRSFDVFLDLRLNK